MTLISYYSSRVYLATKKADENKIKYAIKVINKQDIRRKNLIDQSICNNFDQDISFDMICFN